MSVCRSCRGEIIWDRVDGRWRPLALDGTPHDCRRDRPVDHEVAAPIRGAKYVPSCACPVPPWELCACSARLGVAA